MARNVSGTYSLPAGQPVVSGTAISAATENALTGDLATEITNSLSRDGYGGMRAPMRGTDGSVSAPSISFTNETGTGFFRSAAGVMRAAVLGTARMALTAAGLFADVLTSLNTVSLTLKGQMADGATAIGVVSDTGSAYANAAAKIHSFQNNAVEKGYVNKDGKGYFAGLDAGSAVVSSVADPAAAQDAATKNYVDGAAVTLTASTGWNLTYSARKFINHLCVVSGSAVNGGGAAWNSVATLPAGSKPAYSLHFPGFIWDNSTTTMYAADIQVDPTSGLIVVWGYDNGTATITTPFAIEASDIVYFNMTFYAP